MGRTILLELKISAHEAPRSETAGVEDVHGLLCLPYAFGESMPADKQTLEWKHRRLQAWQVGNNENT